MKVATTAQLKAIDALSQLSDSQLAELRRFFFVEKIDAQKDPFHVQGTARQAVYLVQGAIELIHSDGSIKVIKGSSPAAQQALNSNSNQIFQARTLIPSELIRIDHDVLDIVLTWNEIASLSLPSPSPIKENKTAVATVDIDKTILPSSLSVESLTTGALENLPAAHISQLLERFELISVNRDDLIIKEGDSADYYYVIHSGRAQVFRMVGGVEMPLAELKSGDAFGEEALISAARRNAMVRMKTAGNLLRLSKDDFNELLRKPLLQEVDFAQAERRIQAGARWVDVRFPPEYQHDHIPEAINLPLGELRHAFEVLDKNADYVVYCQSGRRSSAAAFLLAQQGFRVAVLVGGLWGIRGYTTSDNPATQSIRS